MSAEELRRWCEKIPDMISTGAGAWEQKTLSRVSFPDNGLTELAPVESRSYWFNHRNEIITAVVKRYAPSGPIFDIGGGNGYVSLALEQSGLSSIVVEPDSSGIATAKARGLLTVNAAFQDIEIPNGAIPAAGLFDVLEHIEDDLGALTRLFKGLKPGGMIYIAVPAYKALWSVEDVHAGHFRRYTRQSLSDVVSLAGFTPVFSSYFFSVLVVPVFLLRGLPSHLGLRSGRNENSMAEHLMPGGVAGAVFRHSFKKELRDISAGRSVKFGTSVLVAAIK